VPKGREGGLGQRMTGVSGDVHLHAVYSRPCKAVRR
jgi:hypothetical protein